MPPPSQEPKEEKSSLEVAREQLYAPIAPAAPPRTWLHSVLRALPAKWKDVRQIAPPVIAPRQVKWAKLFFVGALTFFGLALVVAGFLIYVGGESVSVNNISLQVQGPSTIAGGDTVPITIAITNRNPVDIKNASLEADFPPGARKAENVSEPLLAYSENLGDIKSGQTVTRAIKGVIFGTAGQTINIPIALTYRTGNSSATFVKKYAYPLAISSTPLSISVDTVAETVAGKTVTITLQARSNAQVPLDHVLVHGTFPFGFSLISSTIPTQGSDIPLDTLQPGESKTITLVGTLDGQDGDERSFHFSIGTAGGGAGLEVTYMTQDASVKISAPFLATTLTLNGAPLSAATLAPGSVDSVVVSYTNTLGTDINDPVITVQLAGGAVDYSSILTTNGFYDSGTRTVTFNKDNDAALSTLTPGATGVGVFTFRTVPASSFGQAPSVTFTTSVAGTRIGQSKVPEQVSATKTETIKAKTSVEIAAQPLHTSGPFANTGPIPPAVGKATTYTIELKVANAGSPVAGAAVTTVLPNYVSYTNKTTGQGIFSYDSKSHTVTWSAGDLRTNGALQGSFQVSITPSVSQQGNQPDLTGEVKFTGYDRFAGVNVTASADPVDTETVGDPGYKPQNATVVQ